MTDMSADSAPIDIARGWADRLIKAAHRGPGDTVDAAIHRAAVKHGLDHRTLWRLRYRSPKDLLASVYVKIQRAYEAECKAVEEQVAHNLEMLKALPPSEARDRLSAELARFQADRQREAQDAPHPYRRSTD